jgi:hypothetical protein
VAMSHVEKWDEIVHWVEDEEGVPRERTEVLPIIRNDFTIAFEANKSATDDDGTTVVPREIQIRWVRVLAYELIKRGFFIASFTFDSFQSEDTIQTFTRLGIESDKMSTDRDPSIWKSLKDVASDGRLRMPYSKLLMDELEALSNVGKGKVDHPPHGSKDLADAFSCSISGAIIAGGEEDENGSIVVVGVPVSASGESPKFAGDEEVEFSTGDPYGLPIGMDGMNVY